MTTYAHVKHAKPHMHAAGDSDGSTTRAGKWFTGPRSYFQSVSGDIEQLPGSGAANAHRSVAELVHSALDRVRASILSRS